MQKVTPTVTIKFTLTLKLKFNKPSVINQQRRNPKRLRSLVMPRQHMRALQEAFPQVTSIPKALGDRNRNCPSEDLQTEDHAHPLLLLVVVALRVPDKFVEGT
jgi:hypothetical protein